jgi:replicative DNA helicase
MSETIQALPHAPMAEKSILSLMMEQSETFIRRALGEGLRAEMFHLHAHLFTALVAHHKEHGQFDLTAFVQDLQLAGVLDKVGGAATVQGVYSYAMGNSQGWTIYCQQLRETYALRLAIVRAHKLTEAEDSDEAIRETESALAALREAVRGPRRSVAAKVATEEFLIRTQAAMDAGPIPGASTGIQPIDFVSGGMKPGEFWVIGGKPSRGKSVLMLQIACAFLERTEPVAVFSLEMMRHEIIGRMVSTLGRVDYSKVTQPKKLEAKLDLIHVRNAVGQIAAAPLWIDDSANQTTESILNEAVRLRDAHGSLSLVVVDYLQLIRGNRARGESREEEVARVSGGLKQLAKELHCPVISATQLNEAGQSRESRAIEQDADAALWIVEDGIKVMKLRNGVRNDLLPLYLEGTYQCFSHNQPAK